MEVTSMRTSLADLLEKCQLAKPNSDLLANYQVLEDHVEDQIQESMVHRPDRYRRIVLKLSIFFIDGNVTGSDAAGSHKIDYVTCPAALNQNFTF